MTARVIVVATGQLGRPGPAGGVTSVNGETGDVILDDATTVQHGLLPELSGSALDFLNGAGAFSVPAGSGSGGSGNIDGGSASSVYGGTTGFDGGDVSG